MERSTSSHKTMSGQALNSVDREKWGFKLTSRLELSAGQDDLALGVNEGLGDVQTAAVALRVAQHDEDAGFLDSFADAGHLGAVARHGVLDVLLEEFGVLNHRRGEDSPGWAVRTLRYMTRTVGWEGESSTMGIQG